MVTFDLWSQQRGRKGDVWKGPRKQTSLVFIVPPQTVENGIFCWLGPGELNNNCLSRQGNIFSIVTMWKVSRMNFSKEGKCGIGSFKVGKREWFLRELEAGGWRCGTAVSGEMGKTP